MYYFGFILVLIGLSLMGLYMYSKVHYDVKEDRYVNQRLGFFGALLSVLAIVASFILLLPFPFIVYSSTYAKLNDKNCSSGSMNTYLSVIKSNKEKLVINDNDFSYYEVKRLIEQNGRAKAHLKNCIEPYYLTMEYKEHSIEADILWFIEEAFHASIPTHYKNIVLEYERLNNFETKNKLENES